MTSSPIPIVIVSRNSLPLTKLAVRSALAQDVLIEVLVIDNFSTDGTREWLRAKQGITPCFTPWQWALAECWNWMLRALWKAGHAKALVLNNDVQVRPDTARLLGAHGGEFVTCVSVDDPGRIGASGDRSVEELRKSERPHPDFSAWLIRKSVTDKGIWFNEECFPAYCEDSFAHVAMHRAGIRAVCVDLPFYHYGAGTLKNASAGEQARIRRGADRNRERFRARYGCLPGTAEYEALFR